MEIAPLLRRRVLRRIAYLRARPRTVVIFGVMMLVAIQGITADRPGEHWLRPATLLATAVFMGAVTGSLANLYRAGGRSKV